MDDPMKPEAATVASQLATAFARVAKPDSIAIAAISCEDADEIIRHIHRYTDDVQNYWLPRLLTMALRTDVTSSRRNEWIRALVAFLDLDFEEDPVGSDALLKEARRETFLSYSEDQSRAIYHWLVFVRANYEWSPFHEEINSAVQYWKNRAGSTP
jgi:hypothetical protein